MAKIPLYIDMSDCNLLLPIRHQEREGMFVQTMKSRYVRSATLPDLMPYDALINSMPVFYRECVEETGLELVAIENDLPWCDQDITIFAVGPSNPYMLFDLKPQERDHFFSMNKKIIDRALVSPKCVEAFVGIGFNPEDDSYGCHTIRRLHAHVCSLDTEYMKSRERPTATQMRDIYYRMIYFEPFTPVFGDLINNYIGTSSSSICSNLRSFETHKDKSLITLKFPRELYATHEMNAYLSDLLSHLSWQYGLLESVFTDRVVDPNSNRFLPLDKKEIAKRLVLYFEKTTFFSQESKDLLEYFAKHITIPEPRMELSTIENAGQLWMSKGFSGAFIFRFWPNGSEFAVEYYPKFIATQALTRGNGVNSGVQTYKDTVHFETDPQVIKKMKQYITMAKDALS